MCGAVDECQMSVEPTRRRCQMIGSAIWSLACADDIIIAGCHNGSIEVCRVCVSERERERELVDVTMSQQSGWT